MRAVNIGIVTHASEITSDDGMHQQVWPIGKKKLAFEIVTEKDTFFGTKHVIRRNPGKLPIFDMPLAF